MKRDNTSTTMAATETTVYIVDNDQATWHTVGQLTGQRDVPIECFPAAEPFLSTLDVEASGCLVSELRLPGLNGLELQRRLEAGAAPLPIVFYAAEPAVPDVVAAVQNGAVTVLEKSCSAVELADAIDTALEIGARRRARREQQFAIRSALVQLSQRERAVLKLMMAGEPNKVIARRLEIGLRTVEAARHQVFRKTGAATLAELIRKTLDADFLPEQ